VRKRESEGRRLREGKTMKNNCCVLDSSTPNYMVRELERSGRE
jgi:hypothetical protein